MMLWQRRQLGPRGEVSIRSKTLLHFLRLEYGSLQSDQAGDASNALFISLAQRDVGHRSLYSVQ